MAERESGEASARYFAELYDEFAEEWGGAEVWPLLIEQAASHRVGPRGSWLDVGCGTGRFLEQLDPEWQGAGLDLDAEMLEIARSHRPDLDWHHGDMCDFSLDRTASVVSCLGGSLNALIDPARIRHALRAMTDHVAPGGLLILDVNTPAGLAQWDEWGMADPQAERPFIIEGRYDLTTALAVWEVTLFVPDEARPTLYQKHHHTITQRAIDEDELQDWLAPLATRASLQIIDAQTAGPHGESTTRLLAFWEKPH
jgi:SAM-dependent methyltransferase